MEYNRRKFISFLGKASVGAMVVPPFLIGCGNNTSPSKTEITAEEVLDRLRSLKLEGIPASDVDDLLLAKGLDHHVVIKWGDKLSEIIREIPEDWIDELNEMSEPEKGRPFISYDQ